MKVREISLRVAVTLKAFMPRFSRLEKYVKKWISTTNIAPEKAGFYVGKALAKMRVFLSTDKTFDIVEILREE